MQTDQKTYLLVTHKTHDPEYSLFPRYKPVELKGTPGVSGLVARVVDCGQYLSRNAEWIQIELLLADDGEVFRLYTDGYSEEEFALLPVKNDHLFQDAAAGGRQEDDPTI